MAFDDTYRESIQTKHIGNVGFTSTAKGVTNEGFTTKNPHAVLATQVPIVDVVADHGPLVASGIAANLVEQHTVELTADPTVNNNLNWIAYEDNCSETGHAARGHKRLDNWMRVAETQYKLRLFQDNGSSAPDYGTEILPSDVNFNWEYNASAGTVYFDSNPGTTYTTPIWGQFYKYTGETVADKLDTTTSGTPVNDSFGFMSDGIHTGTAVGQDTIEFRAAGGATVAVDSGTNTVTISGSQPTELVDVNMVYNVGTWEYAGGLASVPADLQIYLNGNKNKDDIEYYTATVSAGTLQIVFNFSTYATDWCNAVWSSPMTLGGGMHDWIKVTSAATISNRDRLLLDSSSGGFNVTLPAAPSIGQTVSFIDGAGSCGTNNVIVLRNGSNIMSLPDNLEIDSPNANFSLVYYNAVEGWRLSD